LVGLVFAAPCLWLPALGFWAWAIFDAHKGASRIDAELHQKQQLENERAAEDARRTAATTETASGFATKLLQLHRLHVAGMLDATDFAARKSLAIADLATKRRLDTPEQFLSDLASLRLNGGLSDEDLRNIKNVVL
jgi:hypothetical protein